MSMIDTSDKSLNKSPFFDLKGMDSIPENPFDGLAANKVRECDRFSTRSCIFTAFIMVAICLMMPYNGGGIQAYAVSSLWVLGAAVVYVLFWSFTMRFFESPDMMPVSIVLNLIPAVVLSLVFGDKLSLDGLVFLGAGLTALTLEASDLVSSRPVRKDASGFTGIDFLSGEMVKYTEFIKAGSAEIVLPFIAALFSSLSGVLITEVIRHFTHTAGKGLRIIISTLILILLSVLISRIRGKDMLFSSEELCDAFNLPRNRYRHLRSFILRRTRFLASIVLVGTGCLIADYIDAAFGLGLPFMKHILSALLVFAFAFARGRQSKHRIQFATELAVILAVCVTRMHSIFDLIAVSVFITGVDLLITSMMYTRNRRLIMSRRSPYIDGMPLSLLSAALIYMVMEVVLGYWGIVL